MSLQTSEFSRQLWQSGLPAEHDERVVLTFRRRIKLRQRIFIDKAGAHAFDFVIPESLSLPNRVFGSLAQLAVRPPRDFLPRAERFRPKKHRLPKCEGTRHNSFCAHRRSTYQGEEIMNRLKHDEFTTNLNSSLEADSTKTTLAAHNQEVVPIPDGMQAFLESIDTCFADPSFWSGL